MDLLQQPHSMPINIILIRSFYLDCPQLTTINFFWKPRDTESLIATADFQYKLGSPNVLSMDANWHSCKSQSFLMKKDRLNTFMIT